jgi:hypothetical protein
VKAAGWLGRFCACAAAAWALAACGSDRPLVVVRLDSPVGGYKRVAAIATLNGVDGHAIIDYVAGNDEIGVELPPHARGALEVVVGGYDVFDCVAAVGWVDVVVEHDSVLHAKLTLQTVDKPVCM